MKIAHFRILIIYAKRRLFSTTLKSCAPGGTIGEVCTAAMSWYFTSKSGSLGLSELSELSELSTCSFCKVARAWNPSLCWGTGDWKCGGKSHKMLWRILAAIQWSISEVGEISSILIHFDPSWRCAENLCIGRNRDSNAKALLALPRLSEDQSHFCGRSGSWQLAAGEQVAWCGNDVEMMRKWCGNDEQSGLKIGFSELLLGRKAIPIAIVTGRTMTHLDLREVGPDRASETSSLVLVCYS